MARSFPVIVQRDRPSSPRSNAKPGAPAVQRTAGNCFFFSAWPSVAARIVYTANASFVQKRWERDINAECIAFAPAPSRSTGLRIVRRKYVRLKLVGRVAQVVEQRPFKAWVAGSNPAALTISFQRLEHSASSKKNVLAQIQAILTNLP